MGYPDQQLLEKQFHLLGIVLQIPNVAGDFTELVNAHAPFDAAVDGVFLYSEKPWPVLPRNRMKTFSRALWSFSSSGGSELVKERACRRNYSSTSKPSAEAPMPTMGKGSLPWCDRP
jgi:hypothetical protein